MTNEQKQALALELLSKAGDLLEFWDEQMFLNDLLNEVTAAAAGKQLAIWLKNLPGSMWDKRIPLPE